MINKSMNGQIGNHTHFPKDSEHVVPVYQMYPLTSYPKDQNGNVILNISEEDVIRLRDFDIENKK